MSKQAATIYIEGMTCQGCVKSVVNAVSALSGVDSVDVSLEKKHADVSFDMTQVSLDELRECIEDAGFDVMNIQ
ncbi:copper ion binding protein [Psychrobacter sp. I-STPA6b]|uniref:copper ion binding protein n=1 Tax=Psychrobacter sp. I-STPA6b TaxID=2585718 RepID=UPI001D0C9DB2|nr:copper ion binding protein [Psychrobacter sp. I-STPA6b]